MTASIWWIRRDLRLTDNPSLAAALAQADQAIPAFILDPSLLGSSYFGSNRWAFLLEGLRRPCDGHDTALHEFAHVLDRASGRFDGTPNLRASEHYRPWAQVMSRHFLKLKRGGWHQHEVLRGYGAKNEAEFFAVATESFFEKPLQMRDLTPDLYDELKRFYGFDPATDPSIDGIISERFRQRPDVIRQSDDPWHPMAAWGRCCRELILGSS